MINTPKTTPPREGKSSAGRLGKQPVSKFSWHEVGSTFKDQQKEAKVTNKEELSLIQRSSKKEKLKPSLRKASLREASLREASRGIKKLVSISKSQKKKPKEVISKDLVQDNMSHILMDGNRSETGSKDGSKDIEDVKVQHSNFSSERVPSETNVMLMDVSPTGTDGNKESLDK